MVEEKEEPFLVMLRTVQEAVTKPLVGKSLHEPCQTGGGSQHGEITDLPENGSGIAWTNWGIFWRAVRNILQKQKKAVRRPPFPWKFEAARLRVPDGDPS
jgi:hypothetical protein